MNPTPFPLGNNKVPSTRVLFEDRKNYKEFFVKQLEDIQTNGKIPFADLYLDNALYGLIDLDADLIQLKNPDTDLVSIVGFNNETYKILNFVADAYADLKGYFYRAMVAGKIPSDSFMTQLQIYRAHINPNSIDEVLKFNIRDNFKKLYVSNLELNATIKDYDTFVEQYNNYLFNNIHTYPVTKASSLLQSNFLGFSSGLIFDIANLATDDDLQKYLQFLSSEQFKFFADGCLRFGFRIDKNVPWRLIADLNSRALNKYYEKYNVKNLKDIFAKYFKKIYNDELDNLKKFYFDSYNNFINNNEIYYESYKKLCDVNVSSYNVLKRSKISESQFYNKKNNLHWIKLYTYFKNNEFRRGLTQTEFDNIVREAAEYAKYGNISRSLKYINDFFKNYNNILFYYSKQTVSEESLDDVTNKSNIVLKL